MQATLAAHSHARTVAFVRPWAPTTMSAIAHARDFMATTAHNVSYILYKQINILKKSFIFVLPRHLLNMLFS